jgi:hypothetical protein
MGRGCDRLTQASRDFYHRIFPGRIPIPDGLRSLLEGMYPTIAWDSVTFHHGIPWIMRASRPAAITLPGTFQFHRIHIYLREDLDVCDGPGLATPVHEAFHVLQYRDLLGGWGLGYLRAFITAYIACGITQGGGAGNGIEAPAYAHEAAFSAWNHEKREGPGLVRTSSGIDFWGVIRQSTPLMPWLSPLWFLIAFVLTILTAILEPIVELILLIIAGLLWIATGIVCLAEASWKWFTSLFVAGLV